jgi:pyridinium-3,5-bisthiocarboxylic acid mononucleotide nickel chelatase
MKMIHFDLLGGASGDMLLGALIGLGIDANDLEEQLNGLAVEPIHLHVRPAASRDIHGTQVVVHTNENGEHHHHHPEPDTHHHHHHAEPDAHHHHHHHHAPHRGLNAIRQLIQAAALPDAVKSMSLTVFQRLGEAEAEIHGTTVDQIHFHEVGALDSIADIVGCCLCLHQLGVDQVSLSPLPYGHGTIECAHGTYPNPAPATVALSRQLPTIFVDEPFELVTPTAAALLSTWRTQAAPAPGAAPQKVAYSIGHRTLHTRPNVLRATLYETTETDTTPDTCLVLESNIDDTPPELIGILTEKLLDAGALDVYTVPVSMKKQRPGTLLTILCTPATRETMLDLVFAESTTFGIRESHVQRTVLERQLRSVETPYGTVRIKVGKWRGKEVTRSPEIEDCRQHAATHGVPVRVVYDAALRRLPI